MPNILTDLIIDRVDLVDEGANSAAFVELFKRKEQGDPMELSEILSKMKPEHAGVVQQRLSEDEETVAKLRSDLDTANQTIETQAEELTKAKADLEKANAELAKAKEPKTCECGGTLNADGVCESCGKSTSFDETEVLKSLPEAMRNEFLKMRAQKEAAEEQVRKAAEEKAEAEAVAKAATLKALPVEQSKLVEVIKSCDPAVVEILTTVAAAIDGTVLDELGKSVKNTSGTGDDAWSKIEAEAAEIMKRDNVTKQKAIGTVIKEKPELYREYLNGGAE